MQVNLYARYYVIALIVVIFLKVLFIVLNRMAKTRFTPPASFFLATLVFSYLGLTGGFIVGYMRQPAITISVFSTLLFICGTISVIFSDRYHTGFSRKIGTYSIILISMALAVGSGTDNFQKKRGDDIDAKNVFQHETKKEKYKVVLKRSEQAFVFYQSM
jgi:hypothetical protein